MQRHFAEVLLAGENVTCGVPLGLHPSRNPARRLHGDVAKMAVRARCVACDNQEGDDSAALRMRNVFFRPDEILHEEAGEIFDQLNHFSMFLRCAIEAGGSRRAVEDLPGEAGADARATLSRTVNTMVRPARDSGGLPAINEHRKAAGSLRFLQAAAVG